jgi:hypothetical protein
MDLTLENLPISETTSRLLSAGGAAAMIGGSAIVAYFDPSEVHFFPVCPLYAMTGFACPGCGLTRGFHALFHGDIPTALHFNAMIPIWAVIFGVAFVSLGLHAIRGRGLPVGKMSPHWLWVFMIVLIVFGVVRNVPAYPFTLLFP